MPLYTIEKKMIAYLTVECDDLDEAHAWVGRIVATLEDEDGNQIPPDEIEDFEASFGIEDVQIELLDEDSE